MRILSKEENEQALNSRVVPPPTTFSKYQLVQAIKEYDLENETTLFNTLYGVYASNVEFQFYWNTVKELDIENDDFKRFVAMFNLTDEQKEDILRKIK